MGLNDDVEAVGEHFQTLLEIDGLPSPVRGEVDVRGAARTLQVRPHCLHEVLDVGGRARPRQGVTRRRSRRESG